MKYGMRLSAALAIYGLLLAAAPHGVAQSTVKVRPSKELLNSAGQPLKQGDTKLVYQATQWQATPIQRAAPANAHKPSTTINIAETQPVWAWTALGTGIGSTGLFSLSVGRTTEVIAGTSGGGFWGNSSWVAMRVGKDGKSLQPYFRSASYASGIAEIFPMKATSTLPERITAALTDGSVIEHRADTKAVLTTYKGPCATRGGLVSTRAADVSGDGVEEQVSLCGDSSLVAHDRSTLLWSVASVGGRRLTIGQMDDDASLEVASTSGKVIDVATRSVQWTYASGFGNLIESEDIDGDGRAEIIAADGWYWVYAYDVERKLPKWSLRADHDIAAMTLADVDGDGVKDLLIGDGQWGAIHVHDALTTVGKGAISNPEHGVTRILVADINKGGSPEILFGAGFSSTGPDHLYVADWQSRTITWQNDDLVGPFIGPEIGDIDGDGVPEIVFASSESDSGYGSGRIIVMDSRTNQIRAISSGIAGNLSWTGLRDLKLRDVNGDGVLDVLIAADRLYDGVIEAYGFSTKNAFSLIWTNATQPSGSPFTVVDLADVDGDGKKEIVAGNGVAHTGSLGTFLYAYDLATKAEKWRTINMPGGWSGVSGMRIGDIDGDGSVEMLAMVPSLGVYVFDGLTHAPESILSGSFTSMSTSDKGLTVLGTATGGLTPYSYDGATLNPGSTQQLVTTSIAGVTDFGKKGLWIGSDGVLRKFNSQGMLKMQSANYGTGTGVRTALHPNGRHALTCTQQGVLAFPR